MSGRCGFPSQFGSALAVVGLLAGTTVVYTGKKASMIRSGVVQMNDMLAAADPKHGETLSKGCTVCHNFRRDDAESKVGPNLAGIVGRRVASEEGYLYSQALLDLKGEVWTTDALYEWLRDPAAFAPGTLMPYGGLLDPQDRMDLIAYLISVR